MRVDHFSILKITVLLQKHLDGTKHVFIGYIPSKQQDNNKLRKSLNFYMQSKKPNVHWKSGHWTWKSGKETIHINVWHRKS